MNLFRPVALLFTLNLVDALLTLYWVRAGIADESNQLMAALIDMGDMPFLMFKLSIGICAAGVLLYGSKYRLARLGVDLAIAVYSISACAHLFTGLVAYGFLS